MTNKTIKKLEKEKARINKLIDDEQARIFKTFIPKLEKTVGKYLVYRRNCYSCPQKDTDYWDMYGKILSVVDNYTLKLLVSEVDSRGIPSIKHYDLYVYPKDIIGNDISGWSFCDEQEYEEHFEKVFDTLFITK